MLVLAFNLLTICWRLIQQLFVLMTSSDTFDTSTYTRKPTDVIDLTFDEDGVKIEPEDDLKVTALFLSAVFLVFNVLVSIRYSHFNHSGAFPTNCWPLFCSTVVR